MAITPSTREKSVSRHAQRPCLRSIDFRSRAGRRRGENSVVRSPESLGHRDLDQQFCDSQRGTGRVLAGGFVLRGPQYSDRHFGGDWCIWNRPVAFQRDRELELDSRLRRIRGYGGLQTTRVLADTLLDVIKKSAAFMYDYGRSPDGGLYYNVLYSTSQGLAPGTVWRNNDNPGSIAVVNGAATIVGASTGFQTSLHATDLIVYRYANPLALRRTTRSRVARMQRMRV